MEIHLIIGTVDVIIVINLHLDLQRVFLSDLLRHHHSLF